MSCSKISALFLLCVLGALACEAKTSYHKEIEEGTCKESYSTWSDISYVGIARKSPHKGWMVPMSSKHLAYHLGLQLTGNDSLPETDLQGLCLRVSKKGIISYHNEETLLFQCTYALFKPVHCSSTHTKPDSHAVGPIKITLVWMDSSSRHLLLVLCASEAKEKYWLLASNEAVVDSKVKEEVLGIVSDLGFDRKKVLYHDHSKCTEDEKSNGGFFSFG